MIKNMKHTVVTMLSLFFLLLVSNSIQAQQEFEPDHYLTYNIKAVPFSSETVTLRDQFLGPVDFRVRKPIKLFNPTVKRHAGQVFDIKNRRLHYTGYRVRPTTRITINESVLVFNQFGEFIIDRFRPNLLLVPTRKRSDFFKKNTLSDWLITADHYLCYDIPPQTVTTEIGFLRDQFRSRIFDTLIATRLCNPVAKRHDGKEFDIINNDPSNHLMCFELDKRRIFRLVGLLDQFGRKGAVVYRDDEVCVPSVKIRIPDEACENSLPDENGMCNGFCSDPLDLCLPDPETEGCQCQPLEPSLCVDSIPDSEGMCNGECPENQTCMVDQTGDACECIDIPSSCGPIEGGLCGGICPNPADICVMDITTQDCICQSSTPTLCVDTVPDEGQCNGICPPNETCVITTFETCECQPLDITCGPTPDGQCGGLCPPDLSCLPTAGTPDCECVLQS